MLPPPVVEEHRLVAKCDGGWVVECRSTNDAPRGDTFYVLVQLAGVHVGSGQSRLRVSMQVRGRHAQGWVLWNWQAPPNRWRASSVPAHAFACA
jgi:hypothetical protein